MSNTAIEEQYIKSKQIDMNLNLINFSSLSWSRCQNLKRKKLLCSLVNGNDLAIYNETAQLIFLAFHIGLDILN